MNFMRRPLAHYLVLTGIFFTLVLALPAQKSVMADYNLNSDQYHILLLFYVLPFIGIWFAAFLAYTKLRQYSNSIKGSTEAEGYSSLAKGCGWLAYSLPITAIIGLLLHTIANSDQSFKPTAIILSNYLNLLMPLIGFTILGISARRLTKLTKTKMSNNIATKITVLFILLGLIYAYFSFKGIALDSIMSTQNAYFLPIWIIIFSLTIPYLYTWYIGLLAALEIVGYSQNTRGLLYRQAMKYLGYGIATVIGSSIAVQFLNSVTANDAPSSLNYAFATAYLIELFIAVGYILIAIGASKLKRIEEV